MTAVEEFLDKHNVTVVDPYADWTPPKDCVVVAPAVNGRNGVYLKLVRDTSKYMPHQGKRECARRKK